MSVPFRFFGDQLWVVGVTNALLYAAALALLYAGVLSVFDRATAVLTTVVSGLSLSELYFNNLASTEVPGTFFIAAIFLTMSGGLARWRRVVALGLLGGLATYNRPNIFPMGALAFAQHLLATRRLSRGLARGLVVQVLTFVVCVPLCAFNLIHFGRFTPFVANAAALWYGNNPKLSGDFHTYPETPESLPAGSSARARLAREFLPLYSNPDPAMDFSKMGPYEVDDVRVRYALGWIRNNPGRYLQLIWARFQLFFFSCTYGEAPYRTAYSRTNPQQPRWTPAHERLIESVRLPVRRLYQVLIGGAALGLLLCIGHYGPAAFLTSTKALPLLIVGYYSAPFLLTTAANRYHIPILCLAFIYLAHALVLLGRRLGPAPRPASPHAAAA